MIDEKEENIIFEIILYAGNARAEAYEALNKAKEGKFEEAEKHIELCKEEIGKAHITQTELIQKEINGEKIEISLLMIHAQDHLMTALSEKGLIELMIDMYKKINILENK